MRRSYSVQEKYNTLCSIIDNNSLCKTEKKEVKMKCLIWANVLKIFTPGIFLLSAIARSKDNIIFIGIPIK